MTPRLTWNGKETCLDVLKSHPKTEHFTTEGPTDAMARLLAGDCLTGITVLEREGVKADLVYLDPPFASGLDYNMFIPHAESSVDLYAFTDKWKSIDDYLCFMFPRLVASTFVMKPDASIWIHVDWRANYLLRSLCDEIFGADRFLNEIIWKRAPNLGRQAKSNQFGRNVDTILVYGNSKATKLTPPIILTPVKGAKFDADEGKWFTLAPRGDYTDESIARLETEHRVYRSPTGKVYIKYWLVIDKDGNAQKPQPVDSIWNDISPLRHASPKERTGYPTQKPVSLLKRIIECATRPGDLVFDPFAGSGTTLVAAAELGRKAIGCDVGILAIGTAKDRINSVEGATLRIDTLSR